MTLVGKDGQPVTDFTRHRELDPARLKEPPAPAALERPDIGDTFGAAFRQENLVWSYIANQERGVDFDHVDPTFQAPFEEEIINDPRYAPYSDKFLNIFNSDAWNARKAQIDQETADRETMANAGWQGMFASVVAGTADIPTLIPGAVIVRGARGGISVARTALAAATTEAGIAAGVEMGLHSTQHLRTTEESLVNIGASTVFAGLVGAGAAKYFGGKDRDRLAGQVMDDLDDAADMPSVEDMQAAIMAAQNGASLSAAARVASPDDSKMANWVADKLAAAQPFLPGMRLARSQNRATREISEKLIEGPARRVTNPGENTGEGAFSQEQAVETALSIWIDGTDALRMRDTEAIFKEMDKAGGKMKRQEFYDEVGKAMRRSDRHPNDYVTRAAERTRKMFDEIFAEGRRVGLFKDVKETPRTAASYLSRVMDKDAIATRPTEWRAILQRYFVQEMRKLEARGGKSLIDDAEFEDLALEQADAVTDHILHGDYSVGRMDDITIPSGPLKGRKLRIRDEEIEGFLINDANFLASRYARVVGLNIELQRKFNTTSVGKIGEAIENEYKNMRTAIEKSNVKNKKKKFRKLEKQYRADRRDLDKMVQRLSGTLYLDQNTSNLGTVAETAGLFTYTSFGGLFALSALPEMGNMVLQGLVKPFTQDGIGTLVRNIRHIGATRAELQEMGVGVEYLIQSRMSHMTATGDVLDRGTPVRNFANVARSIFAKASGLTTITNMGKTLAGITIQQKVLRLASLAARKNFDAIPKRDQQWMARLGVGREYAGVLGEAFEQYGEKLSDGFLTPNTHMWDAADPALRNLKRRYYLAVKKATDEVIITPGAGDTPFRMSHPVGKVLTQFMSFMLAAGPRIAMNATTSGAYAQTLGMVTMTTLGAISFALREAIKGNDVPSNPGTLVAEGIDRSGLLGMVSYANGVLEHGFKQDGMVSYAASLFPGHEQPESPTRFAYQGTQANAFLGPFAGYMSGVDMSVRAILSDESMTPGERRRAIGVLPFNNLPYLHYITRSAVGGH